MKLQPGILRFDEGYFKRIWGGRKLETTFHKPIPKDGRYGEAWLVSDHSECISKVAGGPLAGKTIHDVLHDDPHGLLGERAQPTIHGQFPLLLKILDAADYLSVQVHPNDNDAVRLHENDVGKTEMWYVLEAEPGAELICGMPPTVTASELRTALDEKRLGDVLTRFPVQPGTAIFVPAGTVHAIGPGILLAEIQQNSNVTYRVYDWDRVQPNGERRELHIEKSLEVIRFGSTHAGPSRTLAYDVDHAQITVLAACRYFAAQRVQVSGSHSVQFDSFRLLFGVAGELELRSGGQVCAVTRGDAFLVPAVSRDYAVHGTGTYIEYFVPDLRTDIVAPLRTRGNHRPADIVALGGDATASDLAQFV